MTSTKEHSTPAFTGYNFAFYPQRLSNDDLETLEVYGRFCLIGRGPSKLLSAYLGCVTSFERHRRSLVDEGAEVIEAILPSLPCHAWSNPEVCAAACKLESLRCTATGEVARLLDKLATCMLVEVTARLDPCDEAGIK